MGPFIPCSDTSCDRPAKARGMCVRHYARWYKAGGKALVNSYSKYKDPLEKLWEFTVVNTETNCWEWQRGLSDYGYGRVRLGHRRAFAHVIGWEQMRGPVPEGLELDHLCRNSRCWNPDHLEPVTHQENMRRSALSKENRHLGPQWSLRYGTRKKAS